jgi:hypothetical protein
MNPQIKAIHDILRELNPDFYHAFKARQRRRIEAERIERKRKGDLWRLEMKQAEEKRWMNRL